VWLHVISDVLIRLAYMSIPITLVHFVREKRDLPFGWMSLSHFGRGYSFLRKPYTPDALLHRAPDVLDS